MNLKASAESDSDLWLEEVEGERALAWVKEQNAITVAEIQKAPEFDGFLADLESVMLSPDRVPFSSFSRGYFWNFWQDKVQAQGILRRTTYEEYLKESPNWETILDVDALSAQDGIKWVYGGMQALVPGSSLKMMRLSPGGSDAAVLREFNTDTKKFVVGGFEVDEGKSYVEPLDENTLLVALARPSDLLTTSGYARQIVEWHRGEDLNKAKVLFEVQEQDMTAAVVIIRHGNEKYVTLKRYITFTDVEVSVLLPGGLRRLPFPISARLWDIREGKVYFQLTENLTLGSRQLTSGSVLRMELIEDDLATSVVVWAPQKGESLEEFVVQADRLFINCLKDIQSVVLELRPDSPVTYRTRALPLPVGGLINFQAANEDDPTSFPTFYYSGYLTPHTQYRLRDDKGVYAYEVLKQAQQNFNAEPYEAVQQFAISKDGTKIPYTIVKRKDLLLDASHPTWLNGYGGFEVSLTPAYRGTVGKAWLSRGGIFVVANIRGGGEYGPDWHRAAIKENRQRAFDDFAAVAEDLIARKITSPKHLGIQGGSNGGLLTGVSMVQRPELFNAVLIQVPLLDMIRYSQVLAGASWMAEYGDPSIPAERAVILKYSPYQNLKVDAVYPRPLITTSTKDDRVHPGHARRMAHRMAELGHPVLYHETLAGGHSSATVKEKAREMAMEMTYLWRQLSR